MPRKGLNIPIVTALDDAGQIIEADQRRIVDYTIHQGRGADSLFISGTTGEYNRIANEQRQRLMEIGVEEIRCANSLLLREGRPPVEAWVGITAETKAETLENLELAAQLKADMAVVAPLAISDLAPAEIADFFEREIASRVDRAESLVIGLYDNPDIAADSNNKANLSLSVVDSLQKLPFVACLKASTTREVLRNYLGAFVSDEKPLDFTLYAGNAGLIFEIDEIQREAKLNGEKAAISGVVAGTANLFPCEWQSAWQAVARRETNKIAVFREIFTKFEKLTSFSSGNAYVSKLIAAIKQGMYSQGIISSPSVAPGTPALTADEAKQLTDGLEHLLLEMRVKLNPQDLSINAFENVKI